MTTSVCSDPTELIPGAVERCLDMAVTWYAWDGHPRVSAPTKDIPGGTVFTPHKAIRRIGDHLVDHLAEMEALLAGADTIPDTWHGRTVTRATPARRSSAQVALSLTGASTTTGMRRFAARRS